MKREEMAALMDRLNCGEKELTPIERQALIHTCSRIIALSVVALLTLGALVVPDMNTIYKERIFGFCIAATACLLGWAAIDLHIRKRRLAAGTETLYDLHFITNLMASISILVLRR